MSELQAGEGTLYGVPLGVMIPKCPNGGVSSAHTTFGAIPLPGEGDLHDSLWRMDVAIRHLFDQKGS